MVKSKTRIVADLILNLVMVISTVIGVWMYFLTGPDVLGSGSSVCFCFYTTESNILVSLTALVIAWYDLRMLRDPTVTVPLWATVLKFIGATCAAVTFFTVLFFLAPVFSMMAGANMFFAMFAGNLFMLHFSTPVIGIITVLFVEHDHELTRRHALLGVLPVAVYSVIYTVMVVFLKVWPDWYGFTFGGNYGMYAAAFVAFYLLTYLMSWAMWRLRRRLIRRKSADAARSADRP